MYSQGCISHWNGVFLTSQLMSALQSICIETFTFTKPNKQLFCTNMSPLKCVSECSWVFVDSVLTKEKIQDKKTLVTVSFFTRIVQIHFFGVSWNSCNSCQLNQILNFIIHLTLSLYRLFDLWSQFCVLTLLLLGLQTLTFHVNLGSSGKWSMTFFFACYVVFQSLIT